MWIMVERSPTQCMDPYPWDDNDEEMQLIYLNFAEMEVVGSVAIHLS